MKKGILIVAIISLVFIIWFNSRASEKRNESSIDNEKIAVQPVKKVMTANKIKDSSIATDEEYLEKSGITEIDSCENLDKAYPGFQEKLTEFLSEVYISGEQAASSDVYSQMAEQSLVSLANGGDKDAMFIHGTNLIWQGAMGIRIFRNTQYEKPPSSEMVKAHKIDFGLINKGYDLLYESALKGKFGALMEIKNGKQLAASNLIRNNPKSTKIKQLLAEYLTYSQFLSIIHKNDTVLSKMFILNENHYDFKLLDRKIKQWKPEISDDQLSSLINEIKSLSSLPIEEMTQKWITDREFLGEEPFPQLLSQELANYSTQHSKLCVGSVN